MASSYYDRYRSKYDPALKHADSGPGYDPEEKRKAERRAKWGRLGANVAPLAGTAIGGLAGTMVPGVGNAVGAGLGAAAGSAVGGLLDFWSDDQTEEFEQADYKKAARMALLRDYMRAMG